MFEDANCRANSRAIIDCRGQENEDIAINIFALKEAVPETWCFCRFALSITVSSAYINRFYSSGQYVIKLDVGF